MKPTYGRVSRYGLIAFASSLDQIGPFARTVEDAANLLEVISGHDPKDSTSLDLPVEHYAAHLNDDIKGMKVGVIKELMTEGLSEDVQKAVEKAIEDYKKLGAEIVEISLPHLKYSIGIYYILATLLPVDKIIGKIYPLFAVALLFMAIGILVMLYVKHPVLPEFWDGLQNTNPNATELPIFPIMFVSIACGAISGFHATQSPLMARCMTSERHGRPVFYGAMITEGIVALIWAAAATYFFHENGMGENNAAVVVDAITKDWLGTVGGFLAILGVIAAPITSGDTAFRSARLIVADFLGMEQKSIRRRLYICVPMFLVAIGLLLYSLRDKEGFDMIWRYFAWTNQTLSVFTLWAITVYLVREKKGRYFYVTYFPAIFMTAVCTTYICIAPEGFGLGPQMALTIAIFSVVIAAFWFNIWYFKTTKKLW